MSSFTHLLPLFLSSALFHSAIGKQTVIPQPFYNRNNAGVWTGPMIIGTPSQWLQVRLDTEASDVFFIDKYCKTPGCTKNRVGFDNKKSSTFHEFMHIPYSTEYLGSKQSGRLFFEYLTGLGAPIGPIYFPLVSDTTGELTEAVGDGLAGLGFGKTLTMFPNIRLVTGLIGEQMHTFHVDNFNYSRATGLENSGYGVFGGNDEDNCKTDIVWHPISVIKRWILKLDKIQFGSKSFSWSNALVRPGPQKIYGPKDAINTILQVLNAQKDGAEYFVNCNSQSSLPNFDITIGSKTHSITPKQYLAQSLDDPSKCAVLFGETNNKVGDQRWVIGDPIYRDQCVLFHIAKQQIGFVGRK